eukprot:GFUD01046966.1.p1 GENE.GFUD01046966.1~~GFUD01046966.1.p1  ORF type:complete len:105 (-),score=12.27 GFUD01046966.1:20-289(-)
MWWVILFIAGITRGIFSFCRSWIVRAFVNSRPPGRKMVTADINVFAHMFLDAVIVSDCLEFALWSVVGPLPYWVVFAFVQLYKESLSSV